MTEEAQAAAMMKLIEVSMGAFSPIEIPRMLLAELKLTASQAAGLMAGTHIVGKRELINRPRQHHSGLRAAVTWLHNRAKEMNDPHAESILNAAAYQLGNDIPHLTTVDCPQ